MHLTCSSCVCTESVFYSLREQKDPVYLRDKVSQKHSKEQFESAQRIEQDYSKYFTGLRRTHACVYTIVLTTVCWWVMCDAVLLQASSRPAVCPTYALRSWPSWTRSRTKCLDSWWSMWRTINWVHTHPSQHTAEMICMLSIFLFFITNLKILKDLL